MKPAFQNKTLVSSVNFLHFYLVIIYILSHLRLSVHPFSVC